MPEWSRPERVNTIGERPRPVAIEADQGERAALARRFDLIAIERLTAEFTVRREGGAILAQGRVTGAVMQACSATGTPVPAAVDEAVELRFVDDEAGGEEELELSPDALDTLPIENGAVDLGEAAAETLALALDPFPRAPDAEATLAEAGVLKEGEVGDAAFGALADLKRKLSGDRHMALAHTYAANPHWLPRQRARDLRAIPGEEGWPLLGNTLAMLRDPKRFGDRMIAKHGRVYYNNTFGDRTVMLIGADANEMVLMDRDRIFSSEQGWGPLLNLLFPRGLMLMDFDHHRSERRTLGVAFKPEPMRHYAHRLDQGYARAVERWAETGAFRFYDAIKQLSLDLAADCFLGMELGDEAQRVNKAFVDEVQASVAPIRRPWPGTLMRRGVEGRRYLIELFEREVPRRREAGGQDFFSHFCRATDEAGRPLSAAAIADHMNFLMMAAHDTITSSATSLVMLLGRNPAWQDRLAAEVAALDGDYPGQLDRLVETEWAFKEALRMVPPVPSLPRRALRDFTYRGFRVPPGAQVGISVGWTHYSPDYWDSPDRFDPLRFTPEASRGRHRFAWVPFGGGAHMCLGLHFATMQVRLLVAHLLRGHRIALEPGAGERWQYFPIPRPKDGLPIRFIAA